MAILKNSAAKIALVASSVCLMVYLPALRCGFVGLDDPWYVDNPLIRQLDLQFLVSVFTQPHVGFWFPLTWISLALDYFLWGENPLGYHLTNILLHAVNAGLVVFIADILYRKSKVLGLVSCRQNHLYSAMLLLAGLIFGIHPLRVESVAWVTERKDVLNGLFTFGSILCYLRYTQEIEAGTRKTAAVSYLLSLWLFMLSLMAKSVSVVLPAMLLVADWYPLSRFDTKNYRRILVEKIPYLCLSTAMIAVTLYIAIHDKFLASAAELPFSLRVIVAGNALFEYCRYLLYPVGILPFHLLAKEIPYSFLAKTVVSFVVICYCIFLFRRRPLIFATCFSFVFPLAPVLGLLQNGEQAFAARFTYLPSVIPSIVAAAGIAVLYERIATTRLRHVGLSVVAALLIFYAGMTVRLIWVWNDTGTLWSRVIEVQPIGRAYKERGIFYLLSGKYDMAIQDLSTAIEFATTAGRKDIYNLFAFRGEAYLSAGNHAGAVRDYTTAISISPRPVYFYHRALALGATGNHSEAAEDFQRAGSENGPIEWFEP